MNIMDTLKQSLCSITLCHQLKNLLELVQMKVNPVNFRFSYNLNQIARLKSLQLYNFQYGKLLGNKVFAISFRFI